ncbi:hypothetical protein ACLB1Q_06415 [Escherichia coli]
MKTVTAAMLAGLGDALPFRRCRQTAPGQWALHPLRKRNIAKCHLERGTLYPM